MLDKNLSILVVDDYKTMVRIIKSLLNQLGFKNIDDAENGSMALVKLREKKYDLIISDWNMEPMSGLDLLKNIRADDKIKDIPFIMVTAETNKDSQLEAHEAGVSHYIRKPFSAEILKEKLVKIFGEF